MDLGKRQVLMQHVEGDKVGWEQKMKNLSEKYSGPNPKKDVQESMGQISYDYLTYHWFQWNGSMIHLL